MESKIKLLTIVCQQGRETYQIGRVYNGLMLDRIEDGSIEYPDAIEFIYRGLTKDGTTVFETINAPIEVEYMKAE